MVVLGAVGQIAENLLGPYLKISINQNYSSNCLLLKYYCLKVVPCIFLFKRIGLDLFADFFVKKNLFYLKMVPNSSHVKHVKLFFI